jgi:hypothetical protein
VLAIDDQGNVNNVLVVEGSPQGSASQTMAPAEPEKSVDSDLPDDFSKPGEPEPPLAIPVAEVSVQAEDGAASTLSQTISAAAAKVTPSVRSVSHDLPTPPLSEGGDDIDSKEASTAKVENDSGEQQHPDQAPKRSEEGKSSGVWSYGWSRTG